MNMELQLLLKKIEELTQLVNHYQRHHVPCEECLQAIRKS